MWAQESGGWQENAEVLHSVQGAVCDRSQTVPWMSSPGAGTIWGLAMHGDYLFCYLN